MQAAHKETPATLSVTSWLGGSGDLQLSLKWEAAQASTRSASATVAAKDKDLKIFRNSKDKY